MSETFDQFVFRNYGTDVDYAEVFSNLYIGSAGVIPEEKRERFNSLRYFMDVKSLADAIYFELQKKPATPQNARISNDIEIIKRELIDRIRAKEVNSATLDKFVRKILNSIPDCKRSYYPEDDYEAALMHLPVYYEE